MTTSKQTTFLVIIFDSSLTFMVTWYKSYKSSCLPKNTSFTITYSFEFLTTLSLIININILFSRFIKTS